MDSSAGLGATGSLVPLNLIQTTLYEEDGDEVSSAVNPGDLPPNLNGQTLPNQPAPVVTVDNGSANDDSKPQSAKIPAAGPGSRTGPKPVPKSSSALRHVNTKSRTSGFQTPMPEDRDHSEFSTLTPNPASDLVKRRVADALRQNDLLNDSDSDQDVGGGGDGIGATNSTKNKHDYFSRPTPATPKAKVNKPAEQLPVTKPASHFSSPSKGSDDLDAKRCALDLDGSSRPGVVGTATLQKPTRHPIAPQLLPSIDGITGFAPTPGPYFPTDLNTPVEVTPSETPISNPQQRMEWQIMLESVLNSEVLRSETKRITSVDTPDLSRQEVSYQRWLDIRATLRGRGLHRGAIEDEEKRMAEGYGKMLRELAQEVRNCRAQHIHAAEHQEALEAAHNTSTHDSTTLGDNDASPLELLVQESSEEEMQAEKELVLQQISNLLHRIDNAEEQFPTLKKAVEIVPEWGDDEIQKKLEAIYSWYNVTTNLRLQISILQKWTGSATLEIAPQSQRPEGQQGHDEHKMDYVTFLERIQKEGSLQSTFEKRTLSSLNQLIQKAKDTILHYHKAFRRMALPSFEPELVTLINFPTRLMQGALRFRLDYAGKLKEPSVLIIDSLTDDLRTALALSCRVKLQYNRVIVPNPDRGWDLAPCIAEGYDEVLRKALKFFFKLLRLKLRGSVFFKETEILEPEWRFLSTAVESIEGGDAIVATNITRFVNKLFDRIARYFVDELTATFNKHDTPGRRLTNPASGPVGLAAPDAPGTVGPTAAGRLAKGKTLLTLEDRVKWIHSVFDNVRIRSRKLLGFARDIRNRLDNAAEFDLGTLRSATEPLDAPQKDSEDEANYNGMMGLSEFMQKLIDNNYFLVYTESLEQDGIYLIAEPSLQDKPEWIRELLCKCLHRVRPEDEETVMAAEAVATTAFNVDGEAAAETSEESAHNVRQQIEKAGPSAGHGDDRPRYLLLLSPRDPFMWTGKVMHHVMPRVDIALADRRVRLVADGPKQRLELGKRHFKSIFGHRYQPSGDHGEDGNSLFPLEMLNEHMAHMSRIQSGLEDINKGVYMLSDTIIRKVPEIRRRLRGLGAKRTHSDDPLDSNGAGVGADCDELIQNCYSMAAEQGRRALPFIESLRLRNQMTLALTRLAIDWLAFICDDCVPSERKTFKWAVSALGNANYITSAENIFHLDEADFLMLRNKVGSCMALMISHFDILGARSSVAKAQEERERLEREQAERNRLTETDQILIDDLHQLQPYGADQGDLPPRIGPGLGAQIRFNKLEIAMHNTEDRWVLKMREWDQARQEVETEQRLIGRVLDDTRLEDRSLQFLAQAASRVSIRWQQGQFIGQGTFGTVYLAVNLDSGGLMAVKEIRFQDISSTPGLYQQIKDEMSVLSMLSHPNIVEYYGIEVHRDKVYIFEEYCQGGSLAALLEHGRIEDETVIQVYTLQMLEGLVYLHSQEVIHRDIKPDNILLDHMGVIKFVDFGAAKILAKNSRTVQRSRRSGMGGGMLTDGKQGNPAAAMQSLQGTPMYMSPEVIKGEKRGHQGAADIWSLGCVVSEFATGRRPWSHLNLDNEWAIMFQIGTRGPPPLPDKSQLSEPGIDFIRQCLIMDPYERPTAAQMRQHPWILDFVAQLAAEEEAAIAEQSSQATNSFAASPLVNPADNVLGDPPAYLPSCIPGLRSLNSFSLDRPALSSFNSNRSDPSRSRFSDTLPTHANSSLSTSISHGMPMTSSQQLFKANDQEVTAAESESYYPSETMDLDSESDKEPFQPSAVHHHPGHPNHSHPGYEAIIADMQYRKETEQTHRMLRNDSEFYDLDVNSSGHPTPSPSAVSPSPSPNNHFSNDNDDERNRT